MSDTKPYIIDAHTHVFPERVVDRAVAFLTEEYKTLPLIWPVAPKLLAHMQASGVDRSVVAPVASRPDQVASINQWAISLAAEPRLLPFGGLHPHDPDLEDEIHRLLDAGIPGVKLQPHFQAFDLDEPAAERMWETIGDRLAVLIHSGKEMQPIEKLRPTPARIAALIERHPYLHLIVAHLGGFRIWDDVEKDLVGANVHLDLSFTFGHIGYPQIERIIRAHGPERILWGSDFPWQTQSFGLEAFARLSLTEDERRAILSGNILTLLGLPPPS
jgi:predicted TIM-barrel fold metal-dependent hydrolase